MITTLGRHIGIVIVTTFIASAIATVFTSCRLVMGWALFDFESLTLPLTSLTGDLFSPTALAGQGMGHRDGLCC